MSADTFLSNFSYLFPADPKANYLAHKKEIDIAIQRVLESGSYILGKEVATFEQEFGRYLGLPYAVGVGSGTDALHLALRACGIGRGDGVITVSHTAVATVAAIELAGAVPVLIDIDPATFTMDSLQLEEAINNCRNLHLRAVIPVHLYGHPADMPVIMDIAKRYSLYVIEDCAQSHDAPIQGRKVGVWGDLSTFSFYPTKNLGTFGDGGAVVTDSPELAKKVHLLREYGWRERYSSDMPGMNSRLDELHAAILRVKLRYLDEENKRRQRIASIYDDLLSETDLILPRPQRKTQHVYHQYVIRSKQRDELREFLEKNCIGTLIHYPLPVHLQNAYQGRLIIGAGTLRITEQICGEILSLPIYPQMTDEQVRSAGELIKYWSKKRLG